MAKYGMVVDLKRCIGCNACVTACKSEHNTPSGVLQTGVLEKEMGIFPDAIRVFVPVLCNHCEDPTCVDVCPTEASFKRDDGVVMIDFEKCIGCSSCVEHCPYKARVLVKDNRTVFFDGVTEFEKPVFQKIHVGIGAASGYGTKLSDTKTKRQKENITKEKQHNCD